MDNRRWYVVYGICLAAAAAGCFYGPGGEYSEDGYGDYHADETVRQSLTAPAPELDSAGPGYSDGYAYSCAVHAECAADELCAADPECPEYTYCYSIGESETAGCDCGDRYHTVCWEGECILRGSSCDTGCPEEAGYVCSSSGYCVCAGEECAGWTPDGSNQPRQVEPSCTADHECEPGASCTDGECVVPGTGHPGDVCTFHQDCKTGYCADGLCVQKCETSADCGTYYQCQEPRDPGATSRYCWEPRCDDCADWQYCTRDSSCQSSR